MSELEAKKKVNVAELNQDSFIDEDESVAETVPANNGSKDKEIAF